MASAAKTLRVSFVQFRGTPYEVGRAQAVAFAATRRGKAFLRKKVRLPVWFNIRTEERAFGAYAPALWEEIVHAIQPSGQLMAAAYAGVAAGRLHQREACLVPSRPEVIVPAIHVAAHDRRRDRRWAEYPDGASGCLFRQRRFADADRRLFERMMVRSDALSWSPPIKPGSAGSDADRTFPFGASISSARSSLDGNSGVRPGPRVSASVRLPGARVSSGRRNLGKNRNISFLLRAPVAAVRTTPRRPRHPHHRLHCDRRPEQQRCAGYGPGRPRACDRRRWRPAVADASRARSPCRLKSR